MDAVIDEPWYARLAARHGEAFAREAGYFDETRPFGESYAAIFDLPRARTVVQFSGAFHPFHQGHLAAARAALEVLAGRDPLLVVHLDHGDYRRSKGDCDETAVEAGLALLEELDADWMVIREDDMPGGCSRNFTRLYAELAERSKAWFLAGGDRANYALAFVDEGRCIVSGRDQAEAYAQYRRLHDGERILFVPGAHAASSTEVRQRLAGAHG